MLRPNDYFCIIKNLLLNPKKIVITGGPGTGKSSIIHALEASGFFCFHEVIRNMTLIAKNEGDPARFVSNPLAFVSDPLPFNRRILEQRMQHFQEGGSLREPVVFYDRGMPDVLAYMDYFSQDYARDFIGSCTAHRYDKVLVLPPWEAIYISDNERMESFEESLQIHKYLLDTYRRFGYNPVTVPQGTVSERTSYILDDLRQEQYL